MSNVFGEIDKSSTLIENNVTHYIQDRFFAGYFNTTSAIDEIQFKMASGNIDAGTITMYGVL